MRALGAAILLLLAAGSDSQMDTPPMTTTKSTPNVASKPPAAEWVRPWRAGAQRSELADWLLTGCWDDLCREGAEPHQPVEYEGYDGWYNNLARPDQGAIDRPLLRRWPAAYADGSYLPSGADRPNPIELSEQLLEGPAGSQSRTGKNALLVFFGQQVVEEVLDAQRAACPPEYFNIPVPEGHRYRSKPGHTQLPLLRTRYDASTGYSPNNPRQQLNEITPYLDGGLVYGTTRAWADYLRTYSNGTVDPNGLLASSHGGLFPEYNDARLPMANPPPPALHADHVRRHESLPVSRFFRLGNPRGNENTFLLTFGVVWFRWHNYLAKALRRKHPTWSGDRVFNEARRWLIATQQHLVLYRWLPQWLGQEVPPYAGYDPSVDPQIDQFFQAAAMRFGHTLVTPGVYLRDYGRNNCSYKLRGWPNNAVRTCNSFWRPQDALLAHYSPDELIDIDRVLMGMAVQRCEEEDHRIVEDLRGNVFGPLEFSRRDLMAINVQRARDHGLPGFNDARRAFGLRPVTNATDHFWRVPEKVLKRMRRLYGAEPNSDSYLERVDPWIGGILETTDGPGELFRTVIADQFRRIRDGDRFWFEHEGNRLFSKPEIERIKLLDIYDILMAVTRMDADDVPPNPFAVPRGLSQIHEKCRPRLMTGNCSSLNEISRSSGPTFACSFLPPLDARQLSEDCTDPGTYDYFSNSHVSYVVTFTAIAAFMVCVGAYVHWATGRQAVQRRQKLAAMEDNVRNTLHIQDSDAVLFAVKEWRGSDLPTVDVIMVLDKEQRRLQVMSQRGQVLRAIDFSPTFGDRRLEITSATNDMCMMLRVSNEYDLVMRFDGPYLRDNFSRELERFTDECNIKRERISMSLKAMLRQAVTKRHRQKRLEQFFRVVFAQAFKIEHRNEHELLVVGSNVAKEVVNTELTLTEFAETLAMRPDSEFVRRIFSLIDRDGNGFVSFREFLDLLFVFAKGDARDRARLLFDMYDVDGTGFLSQDDFKHMISSLVDTVHATVRQQDLDRTVSTINKSTAVGGGISFDDFFLLFKDEIEQVGQVNIEFGGAARGHLQDTQQAIESMYEDPRVLKARVEGDGGNDAGVSTEVEYLNQREVVDESQSASSLTMAPQPMFSSAMASFVVGVSRWIRSRGRETFWASLYTLVLLAVFAERAYYYSVEREHSGLRQIAGYGVTVTRGAASAMMFTYSTLLLTMCRNTWTVLRETSLQNFVPFDANVSMHKYVACWALFFTVMHVVGHAFNFYHISTQTADDLTCLFRNYFRATHELPKFHYWCWQTMTGLTGVLLTLLAALMYAGAVPGVSRDIFWRTHSLFPLFYILSLLHGSGRLIQAPLFGAFLAGPLVIFVFDTLVSASRRKNELRVIRAQLLPSHVLRLDLQRPNNFDYKSGQWVRLACLGLNPSEFHPFTLSSAPHESQLTVHVRAVGPWTWALRSAYDPEIVQGLLPKMHLDGPYGEGHQDWHRYDVSVLVGGGIGVTPFASILKDIVFRANNAARASDRGRRVYFLWVTKTQRQFEWLIDLIRELEIEDRARIISVHLFITQFYHKFDLRTTLLYICERYFQRLSGGRSLFTGLQAVTHFGRPHFDRFLRSLQHLHPDAHSIGVFSCGPQPMTAAVEDACSVINRHTDGSSVTFQHHYKNF